MKKLFFPLLLVFIACGSKDCHIKLQNDTRGNTHLVLSQSSAFSSPVKLNADPMDMDTTMISSGDYYWYVTVDSSGITVYTTPAAPVTIDGNKTMIIEYRSTWGDTAYWQ